MLIRDAPQATSTASRSGVAVAGDVSTETGTSARRTPTLLSTVSTSRVSSAAVRYVGVPPPIATRAKRACPPRAAATRPACRASWSR